MTVIVDAGRKEVSFNMEGEHSAEFAECSIWYNILFLGTAKAMAHMPLLSFQTVKIGDTMQ